MQIKSLFSIHKFLKIISILILISARDLHKIIVDLFSCKNKAGTSSKDKLNRELYEILVEGLLVKNLELDNSSVDWIAALTRVSLGDESGLDYICKVYEIPNARVNIYKSICTSDDLSLTALFDAISDQISVDLCRSIWKVLNGNSDEIGYIIIRQIRNILPDHNLFEESSKSKEKLQLVLARLFSWTEGSNTLFKYFLLYYFIK